MNISFSMPTQDKISNTIRSTYHLNSYKNVDVSLFNPLELEIVKILEESTNVIWWSRNKAEKNWHVIQDWQRNKIIPNFIIVSKNKEGVLEFLYIVENNSKQLRCDPDTQYKVDVFDVMNKIRGDIEQVKIRITTM